jgi:hypothetical protein
LKECGVTDREYKYWIFQKPKCNGNVEGFTSVRLQDVFPALMDFSYGIVLAAVTFILEVLHKKLRCRHYLSFAAYEYTD